MSPSLERQTKALDVLAQLDDAFLARAQGGHQALAVWTDQDLEGHSALDREVEVMVTMETPRGTVVETVPLAWIPQCLTWPGVTVVDLQYPGSDVPPFWCAAGAALVDFPEALSPTLVLVRVLDLRGFGRTAWTAAGPELLDKLSRSMRSEAQGRLLSARDQLTRTLGWRTAGDVYRQVAALATVNSWSTDSTVRAAPFRHRS